MLVHLVDGLMIQICGNHLDLCQTVLVILILARLGLKLLLRLAYIIKNLCHCLLINLAWLFLLECQLSHADLSLDRFVSSSGPSRHLSLKTTYHSLLLLLLRKLHLLQRLGHVQGGVEARSSPHGLLHHLHLAAS